MEVYYYEDYRLFLLDSFNEKKGQDPSFTHRKLADAGGITNPGFFNEVVKGRRNVTPDAAERLCKAFGLKENEAEYFKLLVLHNQATDPAEKEEYFRKLYFRRGRSSFARLHPAAIRYYQDSSYALVRAALQVLDFKGEYERLARFLRPQLPVALVKKCVRELCEWGLVKQGRDGRYVPTNAYLEPGPGMGEALKRLHREWIQQASDSLDIYSGKERHVSSALIGVSDRTYREILKRVEAFRHELLEAVKKDTGKGERLVQVNIQAFPKSGLLS